MTQPNMPADFFWGNSVSSMQTEGSWQEDGKGLSVYDVRPATDHQWIGMMRLMSIIVMPKIWI